MEKKVSARTGKISIFWENFTYTIGFVFFLLKESLLFPFKKKIGLKVLIMQIYFTGVEALSVVFLISLTMGVLIIVQGSAYFPLFGQSDLIYRVLILLITRELGPLLTAFIITARSGSAITTELGNMVVSQEMDAYMSIGVHPVSYLGVTRLIGVVVSLFLLNVYFNIFGLLGSYFVASFVTSIQFSDYIRQLIEALTFSDIFLAIVKSLVFGLIIGVVSIYYGFKVERAVTEVPQKTIKSIGMSITLCILADVLIVILQQI